MNEGDNLGNCSDVVGEWMVVNHGRNNKGEKPVNLATNQGKKINAFNVLSNITNMEDSSEENGQNHSIPDIYVVVHTNVIARKDKGKSQMVRSEISAIVASESLTNNKCTSLRDLFRKSLVNIQGSMLGLFQLTKFMSPLKMLRTIIKLSKE